MPTVDMTGQRFFRLVVLERTAGPNTSAYWRCRCDCGNEHVASGSNLRRGRVKSCGCWRRESSIKVNRLRHGHARKSEVSVEYTAWNRMWARCTNLNHPRYADWGGRGIKVCDRWQDFALFLADMGTKPEPKRQYTLGRIDNDGDYTPENCRWETWLQQRLNRRDTPR